MNENLERYRMPARVVAVVGAYFLYRLVADDRVIPGVMVGFGAMLVAWAAIDEITLQKRKRLSLLVVGSAILGLVLCGLGLYLTYR